MDMKISLRGRGTGGGKIEEKVFFVRHKKNKSSPILNSPCFQKDRSRAFPEGTLLLVLLLQSLFAFAAPFTRKDCCCCCDSDNNIKWYLVVAFETLFLLFCPLCKPGLLLLHSLPPSPTCPNSCQPNGKFREETSSLTLLPSE